MNQAETKKRLEELACIAGEFSSIMRKLSSEWTNNSSSQIDFILEQKYPFTGSFDELSLEVAEWHANMLEEIKKLEIAEQTKKVTTISHFKVHEVVEQMKFALEYFYDFKNIEVEDISVIGEKIVVYVVVNGGRTPSLTFEYSINADSITLMTQDMPREMFDNLNPHQYQ